MPALPISNQPYSLCISPALLPPPASSSSSSSSTPTSPQQPSSTTLTTQPSPPILATLGPIFLTNPDDPTSLPAACTFSPTTHSDSSSPSSSSSSQQGNGASSGGAGLFGSGWIGPVLLAGGVLVVIAVAVFLFLRRRRRKRVRRMEEGKREIMQEEGEMERERERERRSRSNHGGGSMVRASRGGVDEVRDDSGKKGGEKTEKEKEKPFWKKTPFPLIDLGMSEEERRKEVEEEEERMKRRAPRGLIIHDVSLTRDGNGNGRMDGASHGSGVDLRSYADARSELEGTASRRTLERDSDGKAGCQQQQQQQHQTAGTFAGEHIDSSLLDVSKCDGGSSTGSNAALTGRKPSFSSLSVLTTTTAASTPSDISTAGETSILDKEAKCSGSPTATEFNADHIPPTLGTSPPTADITASDKPPNTPQQQKRIKSFVKTVGRGMSGSYTSLSSYLSSSSDSKGKKPIRLPPTTDTSSSSSSDDDTSTTTPTTITTTLTTTTPKKKKRTIRIIR
ncbi:hypothetical protein HK102_009307, partial [Quaeritorhiza haematococci]